MHMKKGLIVFLVLALILGGLFFWKGGHHAIALADTLEEWLDADEASQSVTILVQSPGFEADGETGRIEPKVDQLTLTAESFWTEYADDRVFGLEAQGMTAYLRGDILYMDTGRAYRLPDLSSLRKSARELALGLLLHGRVTKTEGIYHISMNTDELELNADLTADRMLRAVSISVVTAEQTAVHLSVTPKEPTPHAIPQPVLDAMVRAKMEPPTPLTEPLKVLIPAMENLLPLTGDLTLGLKCGILNLSETVAFRMDRETAELERKGVAVTIPLPEKPGDLQPLPAALLLLRNGTFRQNGDEAEVEIILPGEATAALCAALVPQAEALGMTFGESRALLTIRQEKLKSASLTAEGEVPFLVTTIPVSFAASLTIQ